MKHPLTSFTAMLLSAFVVLGTALHPNRGYATNRIIVASWNVENLFDTEDDPLNDGDNGYTPRGWMRWTERRYQLKLRHLADIIAHINPDILGLMEIENRRVLEDLSRVLQEGHNLAMPYILHRDCDEHRGIEVAMLSRHEAVATNWFQAKPGQREVLAGDFVINNQALTILANHWKSQLGKKEESNAMRRAEALTVRAFINQRLRTDPAAAIVVLGDFNDHPDSPILTKSAGFVMSEQLVRNDPTGMLFYNLTATLPVDERGTYYYARQKKWNTLDAMHVSRGMLPDTEPAAPWLALTNSYTIVKTSAQCDQDGFPLRFRRVRSKKTGDLYLTGYSDHFPIAVTLKPR